MVDTLDTRVERFCLALARRTGWRAPFARAGAVLAGVGTHVSLPIDRRLHPARGAGRQRPRAERPTRPVRPDVDGGSGEEGTEPVCRCTDPQYCYIHGRPCKCCNGTDASCPSGTAAGSYWAYCCSGRRIFFRDCCGNASCPQGTPWCNNSSQPNWCAGAGGNRYVCTLAEDMGAC